MQGPQSWSRTQSKPLVFETDNVELEGTHIAPAALPTTNQSQTPLGPQGNGPDEPRMVLYKHSNRQAQDCICYFNLRRENANLAFHHSSTDAFILYDSMTASALDIVVTCAGEVLFERNLSTSIKPEATLGERIELLTSGQSEAPHSKDEKAEKHFLFAA